MSQIVSYEAHALAAELAAAKTTDSVLKEGFLDLAKQWRALADHAETRMKPKG